MRKRVDRKVLIKTSAFFFFFGPNIDARLDGILGQQKEKKKQKQTFKQNTKSSIGNKQDSLMILI